MKVCLVDWQQLFNARITGLLIFDLIFENLTDAENFLRKSKSPKIQFLALLSEDYSMQDPIPLSFVKKHWVVILDDKARASLNQLCKFTS